jgi:hypothetical protein
MNVMTHSLSTAARMRKTGYSFSIDFMDYFAAVFGAVGIAVSESFQMAP